MQTLELTDAEAKELYMCYMRDCRGIRPREINKSLDDKMHEMVRGFK